MLSFTGFLFSFLCFSISHLQARIQVFVLRRKGKGREREGKRRERERGKKGRWEGKERRKAGNYRKLKGIMFSQAW